VASCRALASRFGSRVAFEYQAATMRRFLPTLCLTFLLGPAFAQAPPAEYDEKLLRQHDLPTDGDGLLKLFRDRTPSAELTRRFGGLLARLNADSYDERKRATAEIVGLGAAARPLLQQVLDHPPADRETLRRVEKCLDALSAERDTQPLLAAVRLVAARKPKGAADALLAYVPFAENEIVREEVQRALDAVAFEAGEPDPRLVAALADREPAKRAAAAAALARGGDALTRRVAPLLKDADPRVRLHVAVALTEAGHKPAVPVLIDLLGELPRRHAWIAQDVLLRLAEDADGLPPTLDGRHAMKDVVAAWRTWWRASQARLDLARLARPEREAGYTLIAHATNGLNGSVAEYGPDGKRHWEVDGLRSPVDAEYLGRNRILVAEYYSRRVTERDTEGNILWEKAAVMPIGCQRLPGGDTFIACRNQLLIVDRDGRETFTYQHRPTSIMAARRLRDGRMVLVASGGICEVRDADGKLLHSFRAGQVRSLGASLDVLPGDRVLIPLANEGRVVEYDFDGQIHWQAKVASPVSAVRLANGNTLVCSQTPAAVVELNPAGEVLRRFAVSGRPWRARRR
jgi:hypothetical protein